MECLYNHGLCDDSLSFFDVVSQYTELGKKRKMLLGSHRKSNHRTTLLQKILFKNHYCDYSSTNGTTKPLTP